MNGSARSDGDMIFAKLRSEILSGVHSPGTAMREVTLAERFGVSRTPIREALYRLQQEGLLERASRGLQVPAVDPQKVVQVYDMRILLEEQAAGEAARTRHVVDVLRLGALVERDRALVNPDDNTRIVNNLEFHETIWRSTHNTILQDLLERLSTHLVHAPHSTLSVGDRWQTSLDEHDNLVNAIEAQDEAVARRIAREHMTTARRLRLDLLRKATLGGDAAKSSGTESR